MGADPAALMRQALRGCMRTVKVSEVDLGFQHIAYDGLWRGGTELLAVQLWCGHYCCLFLGDQSDCTHAV